MNNHLLEINNLGCSYGEADVIKNISFTVDKAEIVGIAGESGSGKSTLFNSILGFKNNLKIKSGEIKFKNKDLLNLNPKEKRQLFGKEIGCVFQSSSVSLVPTRRISSQFEESVLSKIKIGKREIKEKALNIFKIFCLDNPERIYNSYPFELSGGMQQRVSIALSLILEPDLLLCDEPTSALDVRVEYELVKEFARLREQKQVAIVIITHNLALAKELCDRIVVLYRGDMVEYGSAEKIISSPSHEYTKKLISAIPKIGSKKMEILPEAAGCGII